LYQQYVEDVTHTDYRERKIQESLGENDLSRTVKKLGYPSRPMLNKWILELAPEKKRHCRSGGAVVKYTREQKEQAVLSLCSRSKSAKEVAAEHGTTRENLYNWKRQLLEEERVYSMSNKKSNKTINTHSIEVEGSELRSEKDNLSSQVAELQKEVRRFKLKTLVYF
jgi:transposase-like protein